MKPTFALYFLLLTGFACTRSSETTERVITPEGDTVVSSTTTTKKIGLDSDRVERAEERIESAASDVEENVKEGATEIKGELKETRDRIRARTADRDTVVLK